MDIRYFTHDDLRQTFMTLNNGNRVPAFALNSYNLPDNEKTEDLVVEAMNAGFRHIDTAHAYENERSIGRAIKKSGVPREEFFITTKLWPSDYGEGKTYDAILNMLSRLGLKYIDNVLLHLPFENYIGAWRDLEKAIRRYKVNAIGLSNFGYSSFEKICRVAKIKPTVVQAECHPYNQQFKLKERIADYGILLESLYPLAHGNQNLINEPIFTELGKKYKKTNVQIILRWHIQQQNIIVQSLSNSEHFEENFDIYDFKLTHNEMEEIKKLEKGERFFTKPFSEQKKQFENFVPSD